MMKMVMVIVITDGSYDDKNEDEASAPKGSPRGPAECVELSHVGGNI